MLSKEERKAKAEEKKKAKEEKKALAKLKKEEKKKRPRVKSGNVIYIFRALAILIILAFVGLGVYYVLNFENTNSVKRKMGEYNQQLYDRATEQEEIKAFVNGFTTTYFTFSPTEETDERTIELAKYGLGEDTPFEEATQILASSVTKVEKIDKNSYEVKVKVTLQQRVVIGEEDGEKKYEVQIHTYTVSIPVQIDERGNKRIAAAPTYVADPNNPEMEIPDMNGEGVDERMKSDIDSLCKNFLKTYYGENTSSNIDLLSTLVTEDFPKYVVGGSIKLKEIGTIDATQTEDGEYHARVTYTVKTPAAEENQEIVLNMVKKDRFYVKSMSSVWW